MEIKDLIILSVLVALSIIYGIFIWVGSASLGNYIFCGLFFFIALILKNEPVKFNTLKESLMELKGRLRLPLEKWIGRSKILE